MNLEITAKKENALLGRTEVDAAISFDGPTPSVQQMRDALVQKLGCMPELMVIKRVSSRFGEKAVSARLNIYKTKEQLAKIEPNYVLARTQLAEKKKKAEKKKVAPGAAKK